MKNILCLIPLQGQESIVAIATGYGLDDRGFGVPVPVGSIIFSYPRRPDRLWGPPTLLSNGHRGPFPQGIKRMGVKLVTRRHLVLR
jgi:hypothetical protein